MASTLQCLLKRSQPGAVRGVSGRIYSVTGGAPSTWLTPESERRSTGAPRRIEDGRAKNERVSVLPCARRLSQLGCPKDQFLKLSFKK